MSAATTHINPFQCGSQVNNSSRLIFWSKSGKSQTSRSKHTGHVMQKIAQPNSAATTSSRLWTQRYQLRGTPPLCMPEQRWSFHAQHVRGSLGHFGKHVSTNHCHAVPDASATNIEARTHQNGRPHTHTHTNTSHTEYCSIDKKSHTVREERSSSGLWTKAKLVLHILAMEDSPNIFHACCCR